MSPQSLELTVNPRQRFACRLTIHINLVRAISCIQHVQLIDFEDYIRKIRGYRLSLRRQGKKDGRILGEFRNNREALTIRKSYVDHSTPLGSKACTSVSSISSIMYDLPESYDLRGNPLIVKSNVRAIGVAGFGCMALAECYAMQAATLYFREARHMRPRRRDDITWPAGGQVGCLRWERATIRAYASVSVKEMRQVEEVR